MSFGETNAKLGLSRTESTPSSASLCSYDDVSTVGSSFDGHRRCDLHRLPDGGFGGLGITSTHQHKRTDRGEGDEHPDRRDDNSASKQSMRFAKFVRVVQHQVLEGESDLFGGTRKHLSQYVEITVAGGEYVSRRRAPKPIDQGQVADHDVTIVVIGGESAL